MKNVLKIVLYSILIIWIILSIARTGNNFGKIIFEEQKIIFLSDEEKRIKQFGDLHLFYAFVKKNTEEYSRILFLNPGGKVFFLGRYYLYPRRITDIREPKNISENEVHKYNYVVVYQTDDPQLDETTSILWNIHLDYQYVNYSKKDVYQYRGTIFSIN